MQRVQVKPKTPQLGPVPKSSLQGDTHLCGATVTWVQCVQEAERGQREKAQRASGQEIHGLLC